MLDLRKPDDLIAALLGDMEAAIGDGDWIVDGVCDPCMSMDNAEFYLETRGWHRDSIEGTEWVAPEIRGVHGTL